MATVAHPSAAQPPPGISPEDVRQELERIFATDAFQRSRRLQEFLRFITELTLAGRDGEINEHLIGIEVFGRGSGYNPSDDSVVRRQAHALRQKLDDYFSHEGVDDRVVIEVPLGRYVPVFRRNLSQAPAPDVESGDEPGTPARPAGAARWRTIVAAGLLAAVFGFLAGRTTAPTAASPSSQAAFPALQELWAPWLASGEPPAICFSSPYTAVVKNFLTAPPSDANPPRLEVMTGDLDRLFRKFFGLADQESIYISPSVTEAKSGEALGAVHVASLFGMNGLRPRATTSRLLTWEDFRRENLIILGHNEQNRWVDPLLEKYPLRLARTEGRHQRRILNTEPRPGEPPFFEIRYGESEDDATLEYALVSMLPGMDARRQLLLIGGLNTQATLMAIEFLTGEDRAQALLDEMREQAPGHSGPWRFQLVLKAEVHDKIPTGGAIELVRVLD